MPGESKKLNVLQRINQVMKEVSYVKKTAEVGYGLNTYKAVQHDDVTRLLHGPCANVGLVLLPNMDSCEIKKVSVVDRKGNKGERYEVDLWASVTVMNIDDPSDIIQTKAFATAFDIQDKAPGKAYSMAVKYCYLKLFMLESGDREEERIDESYQQNISDNKSLDKNSDNTSHKLITLKKKIVQKNWVADLTQEFKGYLNNLDNEKLFLALKKLDGCYNSTEFQKMVMSL